MLNKCHNYSAHTHTQIHYLQCVFTHLCQTRINMQAIICVFACNMPIDNRIIDQQPCTYYYILSMRTKAILTQNANNSVVSSWQQKQQHCTTAMLPFISHNSQALIKNLRSCPYETVSARQVGVGCQTKKPLIQQPEGSINSTVAMQTEHEVLQKQRETELVSSVNHETN